MSRKDYIAAAAIFAKAWEDAAGFPESEALVRKLVTDFAVMFKENNSRFDAFKFYRACGL